MAVLSKSEGLRRDIQLGPSRYFPASIAGSATDYEHILAIVTDLSKLAGTGQAGDLPMNAMIVRSVVWVVEATLTGAATNNFSWQVLQKRAGALLVSTTTPTAVAAPGSVAITPASMANIVVGASLLCDVGASAETVVVTATTATTFTCNFANTHSSTWNVVSAPLAAVTYASGTNDTVLIPRQTKVTAQHVLLPGDIVTFKRVSSNATGLASPAGSVSIDWVPAQGYRMAG